MNRQLTIIGAILRKDAISLWPFALLVVALEVGQLLQHEFGVKLLSPLLLQYLPFVEAIAFIFLILSVIHQDATASLRHDSLTRPLPRRTLLAAKALFIFVAILLPAILGTFIASLVTDRSLIESLLVATTIENPWRIVLVLLIFAIGAVTATLLEAAGAFVGLFIAILLIEPWATRLSTTGEAIFFLGSGWVLLIPLCILALFALAVVLWLQYSRRRTGRARTALAIAALLLISSPAFFNWKHVFSVQKAVAADAAAADSLQIALAPDCFPTALINPPAASLSAILADNENTKTSETAGIKIKPEIFGEGRRRDAGQSAIAFATAIVPTGVPENWKVMISYANATYLNDANEMIGSLRPARYTPLWRPVTDSARGAVHFWLMPRELYQRLASQSSRLRLDYSISLLQPHTFEIELGEKRQYLPSLGYCGAERDPTTADVTVECFKKGAQPALIAAEFAGAPTTQVISGDPDYTPEWLAFASGKRHKAILHPVNGLHATRVKLTAYEARAHTDRRITVPGVLGGTEGNCSAPSAARPNE